MKQIIFLLSLAFISNFAFSQPINDNCTGIIELGEAPICPSPGIYTNIDATESNIGNDNFPPCFNGTPVRDVWFSFVASASILNYEINVTGASGAPISNPQLALYRGDCGFDELVLLDCATSNNDDSEVSINITGLTPGITYFLRINDWSANASQNWGDFELCIQEFIQTEFSIADSGSDLCSGVLYDTGGPNGDYGNNENHSFTICPSDPHECLIFSLSQYNIQNGGENLSFYDGPDTNSPFISSIADGSTLANNNSNGGVCYEVVASSGCLTVEFTSNNSVNFEGFIGSWECSDNCGNSGDLNLEVGPSASAIEDMFANPFFDVTVTNINCDNDAYGLFQQGDETTLGMQDGLLLTTGSASQVSNPASFHADNDIGFGGDPDLNFLDETFGVGFSFGTGDVCVVEMDILAKTNRIGFEYVFGSEEYEEDFSPFSDDLIAVLISGPGIVGLNGLNGQENLAWVPGTSNTNLVQIQRVNASTNWEYFRNNLNSPNITYNGLTSDYLGTSKTLKAARNVNACATYHVKIAIGDTDTNDDSGLFIQSSNIGLPFLAIDYNTGIDYLVEGCISTEGNLTINLSEPLQVPSIFNVTLGGSATLGTDYNLALPGSITIPAGSTQISFPISAVADAISEGTETIEITLSSDYGCGEIELSTLTIELKDNVEVEILSDSDTVFVCDGIFTANLEATGAASYSWEPASVFDNPNSSSPTATVMTSQTVSVTGTVGTCTDTDEIFLQVISPQLNILPVGPIDICEGEVVQLEAVNNVNNVGLVWNPETGLDDPTSNVPNAHPTATTTYTASVTATGGCTASDEITINVEPFNFPEWVVNDTLICQNSSVQLAAEVNNSSTTFEWTPSDWLDDATIPNATATPDQTTTYTLTATSVNGLCTEMDEVTITVLPADVDISPDTIYICLGESADISATSSTGGIGLTWTPTDSLTIIDLENVTVNPVVSTWYYSTLVVGSCTVLDSVYVRVDSLPTDMHIEAIPAKDTYCQGEVVSLVSPNYELAFFPDIMFQWTPTTGAVSPDSLYNLAINAVSTQTYIRETTNNACAASDTIEIIVIPVAEITITPENPIICPGESVDLLATADQPIDSWEWSPATGLSCSDCTDPTATPPGTITYQVEGEFMGCPSSAQVTIQVLPDPSYSFPSPPFICSGDEIILNNVLDPNANYQWLNEDGSLLSTEAQPAVSPIVTTTYTLIIDNGLCPAITDEITIQVQEDFVLTVADDILACWNETITLSATSTNPNVTYTWTDINGNQVDPNLTGLLPGSSQVYFVTASDPVPCFSQMGSIQVDIYDDFTLSVTDDQTINGGESINLSAQATLQGVTFIWIESSSDMEIGTGESITVSPCNTEIYFVEAEHPEQCTTLIDTVIVNVISSFTVDTINLSQFDTLAEIYEGEVLASNADVTPNPIPGATYEWFLDGVLVASGNSPNSGDFNVPELPQGVDMQDVLLSLVVTGANGCFQTLDTTITILNNPVEIPNVFTPNGDGTNDLFSTVSLVPVDIVGMQIWNRWGKMVFESNDDNDTWDGNIDGKAAASDVYIYKIQYSIAGGSNVYSEKGDLTLVR